MMVVPRRPKPRTPGARGGTRIAGTNDDGSHGNPFVARTPGSDGSAFEPVPASPPPIRRIAGVGPAALTPPGLTPARPAAGRSTKGNVGTPCDDTQATSLPSPHGSPPAAAEAPKKEGGARGKGAFAFRDQIQQIKRSLPRALRQKPKPKSRTRDVSRKESSVDLADLVVAAVCVVPRHGAGIAVGRTPSERMRTSLMLHMIQENAGDAGADRVPDGPDGKGSAENGKARVARLDTVLRKSIADPETCFSEKSQEVAILAKDTLEWLDGNSTSIAKNEKGRRNLTCIKFLSEMYQEVVDDESGIPSHDWRSQMLIAGAYYALGKFEPALSVCQTAGAELARNVVASAEHNVHCARLFNNLACTYFEMNRYEKAMRSYQRALRLFHKEDGGDDDAAAWSAAVLDQACIMNNMAYTLIKFKQYDHASDLVDASFELQQIVPGAGNAGATIMTLSTMAYVYYRTKRYKLSLDTYSACIQLQDRDPLYSERDQVEVLKRMCGICKKIKDHEKRVYLLRCILVYQQCYLLDNDKEIWETNRDLADALQAYADSGGMRI